MLVLMLLITACGQTGPLYLPEDEQQQQEQAG
jgi:predicted small lipoprotein YifL